MKKEINNYDLAREILGQDFISPKDVMNSLKGIIYTDAQIMELNETVPDQEMLEWCHDNNCILVPGPNRPMSIIDIYETETNLDSSYIKKYLDNSFVILQKVNPWWIMFRKEPIPGSELMSWGEIEKLISIRETIPSAVEVLWCVALYKAVRNEYLLKSKLIRTSSTCRGNHHLISETIFVGRFHFDGFHFDCFDFLNQFEYKRPSSFLWSVSTKKWF